jgi:hypothetical protein
MGKPQGGRPSSVLQLAVLPPKVQTPCERFYSFFFFLSLILNTFPLQRLNLPAWLGVGSGLRASMEKGHLAELQAMYRDWPFFQSTIDLIEMVMAKADMTIAQHYDDVLVSGELKALGAKLRQEFDATVAAVLEVTLASSARLTVSPTLFDCDRGFSRRFGKWRRLGVAGGVSVAAVIEAGLTCWACCSLWKQPN